LIEINDDFQKLKAGIPKNLELEFIRNKEIFSGLKA
jgi:hypothetical protein